MHYLQMRPEQIREAAARNVPAILAAGAVEYHGEHLPVGADTLIAEAVLHRIHGRCECVVFPSLPFSPTMNWAGGPRDGEFDFDADALGAYALALLWGIVAVGFRRVYIVQHHAGELGLPMLTLRRAAAQVLHGRAAAYGVGWGREPMDTLPDPDVFSAIRIASIDSFVQYAAGEEHCPIGHAGRGETQLVMADHDGCVRMDAAAGCRNRRGDLPQWLLDVDMADAAQGELWLDRCADGWIRELAGPHKDTEQTNGEAEGNHGAV